MTEIKYIDWIESLPEEIRDKIKYDLFVLGSAFIEIKMRHIPAENIMISGDKIGEKNNNK